MPQTIEGAFALGAKEMIIVLPDSKTVYGGSMYSSSVTTGNFEKFIAHDVVSFVDTHYRTLPERLSRGLIGHSMGGYGATRIGMKYPEVFGSLYIMSPCCLLPVACCLLPRPASAPGTAVDKSIGDANNAFEDIVTALKSPADAANLPFFTRAQLATAAAWSPNPKNPPLYFDLPMRGGSPVLEVAGNWAANAPLAFIDQYVDNLRRYRAIAIDVGDQDGLRVDSGRLHDVLDSYGIRNIFDIYHGTHTSAVADRIQNHAVPFFSRNLCTTKDCK